MTNDVEMLDAAERLLDAECEQAIAGARLILAALDAGQYDLVRSTADSIICGATETLERQRPL